MVLITIVNGVYKPTYNWGAPHCKTLLQSLLETLLQLSQKHLKLSYKLGMASWRPARNLHSCQLHLVEIMGYFYLFFRRGFMAFRRGKRAIVVVSVPSRYVRPFCRWILYRPYKVPTLYMQGRVGWGSNVHVDIYSHDVVTRSSPTSACWANALERITMNCTSRV